MALRDRKTNIFFWLMVPTGFKRFGHLYFINQFSKKWHWLASTASDRKGAKIQLDISWFYPEKIFFQNIKIKLNLRTWMTLKFSAASMASTASTTSMASMTFTASFHQKNYCSWWLDTPWQPNHQDWSFFCGMDHQKPKFSLISVPFLSEAVEVSRYYFFENWLMKLKYPNLRILEPPSNKF